MNYCRERKKRREGGREGGRERNKNFLGSVPRLSIKRSPRASTSRIVLLSFFPISLKASSTPELQGYGNRLSSRDQRKVLPALMETRSREPPLTAAKPIYLRPRFFPDLPLGFLATSFPRPRILLVTEFVPRYALFLPRYVRLSFAIALPRVRVRSRIVSYTGIFHFSVLPWREKRRIVPR